MTIANRAAFRELTKTFEAADAEWDAELRRVCGKHAGDLRYTKYAHGDEGTELRRLWDVRCAASDAWFRAQSHDLSRQST